MANYETVEYGKNVKKPKRKQPAIYENISMEQTSTVERQEQQEEERTVPHHVQPPMRKEARGRTEKVKIIVLIIIGMVFFSVSVTALVVSFLQTSEAHSLITEQAKQMETMQEQLMKSELERNVTSQLVESMKRELEIRIASIDESVSNIASDNQQSLGVLSAGLNSTNTTTFSIKNDFQNLKETIFKRHSRACPSDEYLYNPYSDTCYRVVELSKNWNDSRDYCTASGQYLATFVTTESVDWLGYMRSSDAWGAGGTWYWVGGYNFSTGWKWTGRVTIPVSSSVWAPDEPDSYSCMASFGSSYMNIISHPCNHGHYFMCETRQT